MKKNKNKLNEDKKLLIEIYNPKFLCNLLRQNPFCLYEEKVVTTILWMRYLYVWAHRTNNKSLRDECKKLLSDIGDALIPKIGKGRPLAIFEAEFPYLRIIFELLRSYINSKRKYPTRKCQSQVILKNLFGKDEIKNIDTYKRTGTPSDIAIEFLAEKFEHSDKTIRKAIFGEKSRKLTNEFINITQRIRQKEKSFISLYKKFIGKNLETGIKRYLKAKYFFPVK